MQIRSTAYTFTMYKFEIITNFNSIYSFIYLKIIILDVVDSSLKTIAKYI